MFTVCLSAQIRGFFGSVFSGIRTEYGEVRSTKHLSIFTPNVGKYGPEKTPYLDTSRSADNELMSKKIQNLLWIFVEKFYFP